jgi:hypothetical protein
VHGQQGGWLVRQRVSRVTEDWVTRRYDWGAA